MTQTENLPYFTESAPFKRRVDEHGLDLLFAIQDDLRRNPFRGATVANTGGARKARIADPERGKGKRGGFRYLYYYFEEYREIYLLIIYGKDRQDNITKEEEKIIKSFVDKAKANIKEKYG